MNDELIEDAESYLITHPHLEMNGISPKVVLATIAPVILALVVALINWLITGVFDATEIRIAVEGILAGGVSGAAGYHAHIGKTVNVSPVGVPSDAKLARQLKEHGKQLPPAS